MARSKEKTTNLVTTNSPVDITKPIVKDFFDRDAEINKFIKLRMPHITGTIVKINRVYLSKDKELSRYRVNYYEDASDNAIPVKRIAKSCYIQINVVDEEFIMSDLSR